MAKELMSAREKRHCMVVHAYYPLGEVRVQREAEALIDHGYQVDVISLRLPGEAAVDSYHGVKVYRLPVQRHKKQGAVVQLFEYLSFFILAFFKLTILHFQQHYGTVQVHNLPDFLVFAALIPRLTGTPVILDLHDLMPEFFSSRFGAGADSWPARLVRWQERLSCGFASHVITVTEHWRQALIQRGVPADKCSVLMNLADPDIFTKPERAPVSPDEHYFELIYHGTIPKRYGLDLVLRAVAQLRADIPALRFTIIGQGDYLEALDRLARELALQDVVRFEKFIPVEKLPERIMKAHLAVVPYYDDIFTNQLLPTKLLEYAALGVPAIASRTLGISAYFDDTMVKFFTPGDVADLSRCIQALYDDRARLAELAAGITQFNRRYNWATSKAEYLALVDRLANG